MPRTRNSVGVLVLKQVYSRMGHNYCAITIPTGILDVLGWEPGILLTYYPTKDRAMKLIAVTDSNGDPEFDPNRIATSKPFRAPRPGSFAESQAVVDTKVAGMFQRLRASSEKDRAAIQAQKQKAKKKPRRRQ